MEDKPQTLVEHLEELRSRIILSLAALLITTLLCYGFSQKILSIVTKPIQKLVDNLVYISPIELFYTHLKLAFFGGIFFASPIIIYQIWKFIVIALKPKEKRLIYFYTPFSFFSFIGGALFAYFFITPLGLKFLLSFSTPTITPMISVSKYISFLGMFLLISGTIFELPLVIMFLTKINIVTPQLLASKRKYAIVLIFIISALLTPPDVVTQILLAIPLILLYEISILCSKLIFKRKQVKQHKADEQITNSSL